MKGPSKPRPGRGRPALGGAAAEIALLATVVSFVPGCSRGSSTGPTPERTGPGAAPAAAPDVARPGIVLEIREWPVPWKGTRPRDPYVAPDGTVWFVGQEGHYLGHLDPRSGAMRRFDLPDGTGPHTVIVDDRGAPWYAGNKARHIGRLDPDTGKVTRYSMPEGVDDPHSMDWTSDGKIWFTAQRSPPSGYVGRFSPATGETEIVRIPGEGKRPYGLVVDDRDRPWFALMGENAIGTVDPRTRALQLLPTPVPRTRTRRLGLTSDGRVWWTDAAAGFLGVHDPRDGSMRQWRSPGGAGAELYAMAVDAADRIWYVESGVTPNRIVGFDSRTETFVSITDIPSGAGSVRNMVFHRPTNALWFGTDRDTIGRAIVPRS